MGVTPSHILKAEAVLSHMLRNFRTNGRGSQEYEGLTGGHAGIINVSSTSLILMLFLHPGLLRAEQTHQPGGETEFHSSRLPDLDDGDFVSAFRHLVRGKVDHRRLVAARSACEGDLN